ncbi:DUF6000 family protein [Streptomyces sp. NPDC002671]
MRNGCPGTDRSRRSRRTARRTVRIGEPRVNSGPGAYPPGTFLDSRGVGPFRHLPRTDLHYDQPAALGALLHLDARLGIHHADRSTEPDGLWDHWVKGVGRLGYPSHTPAEQRRWTDLHCEFANGWTQP